MDEYGNGTCSRVGVVNTTFLEFFLCIFKYFFQVLLDIALGLKFIKISFMSKLLDFRGDVIISSLASLPPR